MVRVPKYVNRVTARPAPRHRVRDAHTSCLYVCVYIHVVCLCVCVCVWCVCVPAPRHRVRVAHTSCLCVCVCVCIHICREAEARLTGAVLVGSEAAKFLSTIISERSNVPHTRTHTHTQTHTHTHTHIFRATFRVGNAAPRQPGWHKASSPAFVYTRHDSRETNPRRAGQGHLPGHTSG